MSRLPWLTCVLALPFLAACSEEAVVPEITGGAGLSLTFAGGMTPPEGLRVELWHDNPVSPPHCAASSARVATAALGDDDPPLDTCSRMRVDIWDLARGPVLNLADVPCCRDGKFLSYGWNTRDNDGALMPSGYYPARMECLDSRNSLVLDPAGYMLIREREEARCEWPVWIHETAGDSLASPLEFGPFLTAFYTLLLGEGDAADQLVSFTSPFILRVHAPGFEVFEREIPLIDERIERVTVDLVPLEPAAARGKDAS